MELTGLRFQPFSGSPGKLAPSSLVDRMQYMVICDGSKDIASDD